LGGEGRGGRKHIEGKAREDGRIWKVREDGKIGEGEVRVDGRIGRGR